MQKLLRYMQIFITIAAVVTLAGCSGDDTNNQESLNGGDKTSTGSVAVLLTDAPSEELSEVNITVTKIELLGEDGRITLFEGEKTVNLLDFKTHSGLFSVAREVPVGRYEKIRLTLSQVELVKLDTEGNVIDTQYPKLPGNGKLDLNPRGSFEIKAGETVFVQLDVDAKKSIHYREHKDGGYRFRPVVFVDILTTDVLGKFVHIHGTVDEVNLDQHSFRLCTDEALYHVSKDESEEGRDDSEDEREYDDLRGAHCVLVQVTDQTFLFDDEGALIGFDELRQGEEADVVGRFQLSDGMSGELALSAFVVNMGDDDLFATLEGMATSAVENSTFGFQIDEDEDMVNAGQLQVQLSDGTGIFSTSGELLDPSVIQANTEAKIIGVLTTSENEQDLLKASVIFVDTTEISSQLSGTISVLNTETGQITLASEDLQSHCVVWTEETDFFLVETGEDAHSSDSIGSEGLAVDQTVDVHGVDDGNGCFTAQHVFIYVVAQDQ